MQDIIKDLNALLNPDYQVGGKDEQDHTLVMVLIWKGGAASFALVNVARVKQVGDTYEVTWLNGPDNRPSDEIGLYPVSDRQRFVKDLRDAILARVSGQLQS